MEKRYLKIFIERQGKSVIGHSTGLVLVIKSGMTDLVIAVGIPMHKVR